AAADHFGAELPISGVAGDQQAALFGQGCWKPGQAKNTYGTGAFLLLNTGKRRAISKRGLLTTLACGPRGEPVFALEGSVFIAGAAMQWLRDGLKIIKTAAESEQLAKSITDTGGVYFVPAFVGLGAPHWEPNARGPISSRPLHLAPRDSLGWALVSGNRQTTSSRAAPSRRLRRAQRGAPCRRAPPSGTAPCRRRCIGPDEADYCGHWWWHLHRGG